MTPLRRLELRLLRECARAVRAARFDVELATTYGWYDLSEALCGRAELRLVAAASLAAEYRDLRDLRADMAMERQWRLDAEAMTQRQAKALRATCGKGCAPGCALERVTR